MTEIVIGGELDFTAACGVIEYDKLECGSLEKKVGDTWKPVPVNLGECGSVDIKTLGLYRITGPDSVNKCGECVPANAEATATALIKDAGGAPVDPGTGEPCPCPMTPEEMKAALQPCFDQLVTCLEALKEKQNIVPIKQPWLCVDGTWQCTTIFYADGVQVGEPIITDSGMPCDGPPPPDFEFKHITTCVDGFEVIQCYSIITEIVDGKPVMTQEPFGDPIETGIACNVREIFPSAPIDICIAVEKSCKTISSAGGGQASDWNDPLGSFEFYMNEEFGGQEVEVATTASMATMTTEELTRLFKEGILLSAGCDVTPIDVVYTQTPNGENFDYEFSMTLCPFGEDECLKQEGWRGFIDMQTNGELVVKTVTENATLQNFCYDDGTPAFTKVFDSQGNTLEEGDYTIVDCPAELGSSCDTPLHITNCEQQLFQKCKDQAFNEGGLDNTFTKFTDTNQTIKFTLSDGTVKSVNMGGPFTGFTQQIEAFATAGESCLPDAIQIETFCTNGCGGLPQPVVTLPSMKFRYVGFRTCAGDLTLTGAYFTSDQNKGVNLDVDLIEVIKRYEYCTDCDGNFYWGDEIPVLDADGKPICMFECTEDIPEVPNTVCSSEVIAGEWCDLVIADTPDGDDEIVQSNIIISITTCGSEQTITYGLLDGDSIVEYVPQGQIVDCDTLLPPSVEPPKCPEDAVFTPVQVGGHYFILDNSNWDGAPTPHITNGFNFEFTFTYDDGTTKVVQQTADPLFNNFIAEASAALGCTVLPVCANHTSPKGCNAGHVANLAMYPAYDAPTFPADIQNNLTNPAQDELWASGWLLDCGDCGEKPVRVEITNASDPAYIGAFKTPIVYDKKPETYYFYKNCDGAYWQDCDGNDVAAPTNCCPSPESSEVTFPEECFDECGGNEIPDANYDGAMPITRGRPDNTVEHKLIDNRDPDNQIVIAEGDTYEEYSASLAAAGYTEFIEGEIHYICPCPAGYDGPAAPDGQYFTTADGNTVTKGGCTALSELASAPEKIAEAKKKALRVKIACQDKPLDIAFPEELVEECCNIGDNSVDRWCQSFEREYPVGNGLAGTTYSVTVGGVSEPLPNPYTEADVLSALNTIDASAGWTVDADGICRTTDGSGVTFRTATCSGRICSLSTSTAVQVFVPADDPECRDYLRTWGKYEEPIADTLTGILTATQENTPKLLVEGCLDIDGEIVDGFTVVDCEGSPLFDPIPKSDLGFVDCCAIPLGKVLGGKGTDTIKVSGDFSGATSITTHDADGSTSTVAVTNATYDAATNTTTATLASATSTSIKYVKRVAAKTETKG